MLCCICSCGGRCISVEYTDRVGEIAKQHRLKLHIDGARIFNASVVSDFPFFVIEKKWFPLFLKKKENKNSTWTILCTCIFVSNCYTCYLDISINVNLCIGWCILVIKCITICMISSFYEKFSYLPVWADYISQILTSLCILLNNLLYIKK